MASKLRNLCCRAIGQASAFDMISNKSEDMTQEELTAIKETSKLLQKTLLEMMKAIQEDDKNNKDNTFLAYKYGDYDVPIVIGIGTNEQQCEKIITSCATNSGYIITQTEPKKFKISSRICGNTFESNEDFHYWIEEVPLNKYLYDSII